MSLEERRSPVALPVHVSEPLSAEDIVVSEGVLPFVLLDESLLALVDEVEEGGGSIGVALLTREQPRKKWWKRSKS